jgi:hypothetical protein
VDEPFDALAPRASAGEERACFLGREEWTETTFTLPKTVSHEDMKVVAELAYIIREGKSSMSFEQITLELDAERYEPFQQGVPGPLRLDLPLAGGLFGKTLHLGPLEMGSPLALGFTRSKRALIEDVSGRHAEALRIHTEASASLEAIGDRGGVGFALTRASVSAYCLTDYEEALRFGRAGHDAFADMNHRWGMVGAACNVGFALAALGNAGGARERFCWALEQAQRNGAKSQALLALSGTAVLLAREGEERRALKLLTFVFNWPGYPRYLCMSSRPELDRLEAEMTPDEVAEAREAAQAADFDAVVAAAHEFLADEAPALHA